MAATSIADVIVPQLWEAYAQENMPFHSPLQSNGVVEINTSPDVIGGDEYTREPKFKPLSSTGDAVKITPNTDVSLSNFAAYAEYGVIARRAKGWTQEDLAAITAGANPMQSGMTQFAEYWARQIEKSLISVIQGAFKSGGALVSTHQVDESASSFSISMTQEGRLLNGEDPDMYSVAMMNSVHYQSLLTAGVIDYVDAASYGESVLRTGSIPVYDGMRVVINNTLCPAWTGSVYPIYLMGGQPLRLSYQRPIRLETDRDIQLAAGTDIAVSSVHFAPHIKGVSWSTSGTITSTKNPTEAELATAANWEKVATNDEDIKLVQILALA